MRAFIEAEPSVLPSGDTGRELEFRILGPLEAYASGRQLRLGGVKQRSVLAILLLHANEVVASGSLIDQLWDDAPPETAPSALQVYVARLRKLLEPGGASADSVIRTRAPGYLIALEPDQLDLDRFERLVEEGRRAVREARAEDAAAGLRAALALWRGPPLADLASEPFARGQTARLEELRAAALEERIEADLALGRHAELVGELHALVADHPFRERLRAQLMLALYRSGRQAEALGAYQETRRVLVEQLGIEPGLQLRELEAAILRQEPALVLPSTAMPELARPQLSDLPAGDRLEPGSADRSGLTRKTVTLVVAEAAVTNAREGGLDPEVRRGVLGRYAETVSSVLPRYGGSIAHSRGGTLIAVFGVPTLHEDDALRAVRAAVELREAAVRLGVELEQERGMELDVRFGIDTGEVVAGDPTLAGELVSGEVLTVAGRLAQSAGPGEILMGDSTSRLVRDVVRAESTGSLPSSATHELPVWRLLEVAAPGEPGLDRLGASFVGRERELLLLDGALERARAERACHVFTVLGSPGVGKSRLVHEFTDGLGAEALVLRGRCLAYGESAFWPAIEIVRQAAGITPEDGAQEARAKIAARLRQGEAEEGEITTPLVALIGLADALADSREAFSAFRRLLEELARERPLVVVVDDLHWAQLSLLDLLEFVADWVRTRRYWFSASPAPSSSTSGPTGAAAGRARARSCSSR